MSDDDEPIIPTQEDASEASPKPERPPTESIKNSVKKDKSREL